MRFASRAVGLAVIAALTATVVMFRPGSEPQLAAQPGAAALPADLALVPTDAIGFVHVRAAELWKNDVLAGFRATFEKAGPKAIGALDSQFVPKPSTFDRLTGFVMMDEKNREPLPYAILSFTAPFDPADVVAAYLPKAVAEKAGGKTFYGSEHVEFAFYFPDRQQLVIGPKHGMVRYLSHESPKTGPLSAGLKLAASGKPVVASVNVAALPIPPKELDKLPADVKPLLKADHVTIALELGNVAKADVIAGYKNAADATEAEKSVNALAEMARKELAKAKADLEKTIYKPKKTPRPATELPEAILSVFALGALNHVDEILANPGAYVKRSGADLTASIPLPKERVVAAGGVAAIGAALLIPAIQKVRSAAARAQSSNNLKQIALACLNYESAYGHWPTNIYDKNGKPLLSWRVAILPFIEQNNLYNQFKLDEPWDSKNNMQWSQVVIKTYVSPDADPPAAPGMTFYKGFAGPGAIFEPGKKVKVLDVTDGTSNTILVAEAGPAVPWAKPEDFPFDPKKQLPKLALPGVEDVVNVALCDGSVRTLNMKTLTEKTLRNAITRDDGNPLGTDW